MKPDPHLVEVALTTLGARPGECIFVGDSVTDVTADHMAGVAVIGYANRPGKDRQLANARANAVADSLDDISAALRAYARDSGAEVRSQSPSPVDVSARTGKAVPLAMGNVRAPGSPRCQRRAATVPEQGPASCSAESSITIDLAQISPSTVSRTRRAVIPASLCARTSA